MIEDSSDDNKSALLQPVCTEISVKLYGKDLTTLDQSNFNFNNTYEDFYRAYIRFLQPKQNSLWRSSKMRISVSHGNGILLQTSQAKTQPPFNAVETEQHYQQMQNSIHATAEKNPVFRNMVMCILVDITKEAMDDTI